MIFKDFLCRYQKNNGLKEFCIKHCFEIGSYFIEEKDELPPPPPPEKDSDSESIVTVIRAPCPYYIPPDNCVYEENVFNNMLSFPPEHFHGLNPLCLDNVLKRDSFF